MPVIKEKITPTWAERENLLRGYTEKKKKPM